MTWIKRTGDRITGYAAISAPSAEANEWEQANENDEDVVAFLNRTTTSPNWGGFRVAIFQHPGFQQLCYHLRAIAPQIVEDLKIVAVAEPVWMPALSELWNTGLTLLTVEQSPSAESIAYWQQAAVDNYMDFIFDNDGHVVWTPSQ